MIVIEEKKLTDIEVLNIVKEWYCNISTEILQDESGNELEEICDYELEIITKNK